MPEKPTTDLARPDRLEILKLEMELLQSRFDKYDDLMFRSRDWSVTLVVALLGASISFDKGDLAGLAIAVAVLFYALEVVSRSSYWYKYVVRYRYVRDCLNAGAPIEAISLYDLTQQYGPRPGRWESVKECAIKAELLLFYGTLAIGSLVAWCLL